MTYKYLSYPLDLKIPVYGKTASIDIKSVKSIDNGDSANVYAFAMENHWGTHVDAPNHFFVEGKKIADYPAGFWFFKSPQVIDIELLSSEMLISGSWFEQIKHDTDCLLLRSGWGMRRREEAYCIENPGIHPDVGRELRIKYPTIRALGIDWVSVSSYRNRELGREAHRALLREYGIGEPPVIIEDMDLSCDMAGLRNVWVLPLRVCGLDSAPCTIIGGFGD
ncbi:MAG: cyclase family protein [Nitrospirae bacterium]|nr:cyclase family protein [Nitrospirota bacterium]